MDARRQDALDLARDGKQPRQGLLEQIAQAIVNRQLREEIRLAEARERWEKERKK